MTLPPPPRIEGLHEAIHQKIEHIWVVLCAYFSRWLRSYPQWNETFLDPRRHRRLAVLFSRLEATISHQGSRDLAKIRNGLSQWQNKYLRRLARSLKLFEKAEEHTLAHCHNRGYFDRGEVKPRHRLYQRVQNLPVFRPKLKDIAPHVRAILREVSGTQRRADALLKRQLCRDAASALAVAQAFDRSKSTSQVSICAVRIAKQIVQSYLTFGAPGLLVALPYSLTDEILRLERQRPYIRGLTPSLESTLQELRADLDALHEVLSGIDPQLWLPDLLYAPSGSHIREQYIRQVTPEFTEITHQLAQRRRCTIDDATRLFELYMVAGEPGLIVWRCGLPIELTGQSFLWQRILNAFLRHTQGLRGDDREAIERRLRHLCDAIIEVNIPLPLYRLVNERVGSPYRRRLGRRLRFGRATTMRRRQRNRRGRSILPARQWQSRRRIRLRGTFQELVEQLIAAFARRASISIRDATELLRELATYGSLGLLEKARRRTCIDSQTRSFLLLFRYGRLDRSLRWVVILQQVNGLNRSYNKPIIAAQLAKVIFRSAPKSRVWHAGVGDAVVRVRQRPGLGLSKREWLLRVWRFLLVRVETPVTTMWGRSTQRVDYIILVIDLASECPLACWYCDPEPGSIEAGLSLFQAIWHPGSLGWPLRGIPEVIQIPRSLAAPNLEDLDRAAESLLIKVQLVDDDTTNLLRKRHQIAALIRELPTSLQEIVRRPAYQQVQEEHKRIQDALLNWIYAYSYKTHRTIAVPDEFRRHGFALPGYDSPGAGWLLPKDGDVATDRRGVIYRGVLYTNPSMVIEPGHTLIRRAFPYQYAGMSPGFFVQDGSLLHYVRSSGAEA